MKTNQLKTFKDIAPTWFEMVESDTFLSDGIHLANNEKCIVGEAHGFSNKYCVGIAEEGNEDEECADCEEHSILIWRAGGQIRLLHYDELYSIPPILIEKYDEKLLRQRIDSFVKHWNERHV